MVYRWFTRFRSGHFSLEDQPRSGRKIEVDDEALEVVSKWWPKWNALMRQCANISNKLGKF